MVVPSGGRPSAGKRSKPLAPSRPAAKKPSAPPLLQSLSSSSSSGRPTSASVHGASDSLKPGSKVRVRTRTKLRMATKTVERYFWFRATVVSADADGTYEVVYKGKPSQPGRPFATVHVARDQIVPEKPSLLTPLPSHADTSNASAATSYGSEITLAASARPTTAGKSLRLVRKLLSEMEARPTTPGS